jgi:hypothetical protein
MANKKSRLAGAIFRSPASPLQRAAIVVDRTQNSFLVVGKMKLGNLAG